MKIEEIGLAHTPANWQELQDWLEEHNGSERGVATVAALMAWNLAASITNQREREDA